MKVNGLGILLHMASEFLAMTPLLVLYSGMNKEEVGLSGGP